MLKTYFNLFFNYHSLSIRIVPARVESAPTAPETFVNITSRMKALKFVSFKAENTNNAITVPPATMKDRFCDINQS